MINALRMGLLASLVALAGGCMSAGGPRSEVLAGGNAIGEYKGAAALEKSLRARLLVEGARFRLADYVDPSGQTEPGLVDLLGKYVKAGGVTAFHNGAPNALNAALWHAVMGRLAGRIALTCGADADGPSPLPLRPDALASVTAVCAWPDAAAQSEDVLHDFWLTFMGYQAPSGEFEAWRSWFVAEASPYQQRPAKEVVKAMLTALFMSPHFLLTK